ncbi:MAG: ribosome-associated translation inhibitor RaiA [Candidatus Cloacimonas sp.]
MQITITARHFELTKAIRDYVESACSKLSKYFDQIITMHVVLALENSRNICELSLHAAKFTLQSETQEMDMYLAIDNAVEKMEGQIKKLKDRITDHQKRALKQQFETYSHTTDFQIDTENKVRKTIKTKRVVTESLSVSEAIEKLEASKEDFLIFKNIESDRINVLVTKDHSVYKLLEP